MKILLSKLFHYVLLSTGIKYIDKPHEIKHIDESHGIMHSMNTLHYAQKIYESELVKNPQLIQNHNVICASAIIHDMCDNKYTDVESGVTDIVKYLKKETSMNCEEIDATKNIITTMSYSTVKKQGYPNLGKYQQAYHIVREADLLCAYDVDRAIIYDMTQNNCTLIEAFKNSQKFFIKRVFQYCNDNLFIHDYAKKEAYSLHLQAMKKINVWRNILNDN
jgi:HD superfamily phosphodiesterase